MLSGKKKIVADGVFFSEVNELLSRELREEGYSGMELKKSSIKTELILKTVRTKQMIISGGKRIREITLLVKKRFGLEDSNLNIYVEKVINRGLVSSIQAEFLRYKLLKGITTRKACYSVLRSIMESGAKGCLITISGKLRAQRAKSMKFTEGYIIHSGQAVKNYISSSTRHCILKQGVIGIKISIMLPWDPYGKKGPVNPLPDMVTILKK
ncbi:40S ribosomal protein S3 (nucleomorph) [Cryptomonas paramecium]|uniref:Small ribosomal subunit protein uS3 n=1 Tax=Cryptomonas paramaecium TaxID=2898 RepID=F2HIA2_9CRYP|nr:40S ribosomal protein S3 [Cryptomonas paramecium]AEA39026.1 40S ribosomal protein S3 [Cryptomonas paramecium]|mmetsp:Transcript_46674/g.123872  ORF Transcript_46674/g.123872 Transcript_46674/m.123872 type:complete len:211 (+) Transcript_46674:1582-2214(+)